VDIEALDLNDLESLLSVAFRWVRDGEAERARRLIHRLLRTPSVRSDTEMHDRLIDVLERFDTPRLDLRPEPCTPLQAAARERWLQPRAA
jgi:hypothetical protein